MAVTGLTVQDFHLLVHLNVFNTEQMNQAVFDHPWLAHVGLYTTVVARE